MVVWVMTPSSRDTSAPEKYTSFVFRIKDGSKYTPHHENFRSCRVFQTLFSLSLGMDCIYKYKFDLHIQCCCSLSLLDDGKPGGCSIVWNPFLS